MMNAARAVTADEIEPVARVGEADVAQDDVRRLGSMSALADRTSRAVPTTVTPGDPGCSAASPSAIAGWSSTIATRITSGSVRSGQTASRG